MDEVGARPDRRARRGPDAALHRHADGVGVRHGGAFEVIDYVGPATRRPTFTVSTRRRSTSSRAPSASCSVMTRSMRSPAHWSWYPGHAPRLRDRGRARALLLTVPAGLEGFFADLGQGLADGRPAAEIRAALAGSTTPSGAWLSGGDVWHGQAAPLRPGQDRARLEKNLSRSACDSLGRHLQEGRVRSLMRVCNVHEVPIATNVGGADIFLASPLLHAAKAALTA